MRDRPYEKFAMLDLKRTANEDLCNKATRIERFRRWLGFRYHLGDDPEGVDGLEGWMRTDIRLDFSLLDRLRLLFTGRLLVSSILHTDTTSPNVCKSRVDWKIFAPGEHR